MQDKTTETIHVLQQRNQKYKNRFVDVLIESVKRDKNKVLEKVKIYDKNVKINKDIDDMIGDIDKMLE